MILPFTSLYYSIRIIYYAFKNKIQIIWVDRVIEKSFFVYFYLDIFRKIFSIKYKLIADTETVYSDFVLRELKFLKKDNLRYYLIKINGKLCFLFENYILKTADVVTAVSLTDKQKYKKRYHSEKIKLFSNTIDISLYSDHQQLKNKINKPAILLLGSYGHQYSPMNRARQWLVNDIMPIVWDYNSNINLYIVGRNASYANDIKLNKNITILSDVESTIPFLQKCDVLVIPLKHESGTRFKIIEAGAARIPCISTLLGAEGLNIEDKKHLLVSDDKHEFANNIIKVLTDTDLSEFLTSNMYSLIEENYSLNKQQLEASLILDFI